MRKRIDPTGFNSEMKDGYRLQVYEELFEHLTSREVSILELGVYKGKSLLLYRDYFEKGTIVGLDLNPVQIDDPSGRIRVYQGYQQDVALLDSIAREQAPGGFDLISDDCSHIAELTRISFWHLFVNHLKPGGIYAIEDINTGFSDVSVDGGPYAPPHIRTYSPAISSTHPSYVNPSQSLFLSLARRAKPLVPCTVRRTLNKSHYWNALYVWLKYLTRPYRNKRKVVSHMYGMVGFTKQLVDICARGDDVGGCKIHEIRIHRNSLIVFKSQQE